MPSYSAAASADYERPQLDDDGYIRSAGRYIGSGLRALADEGSMVLAAIPAASRNSRDRGLAAIPAELKAGFSRSGVTSGLQTLGSGAYNALKYGAGATADFYAGFVQQSDPSGATKASTVYGHQAAANLGQATGRAIGRAAAAGIGAGVAVVSAVGSGIVRAGAAPIRWLGGTVRGFLGF